MERQTNSPFSFLSGHMVRKTQELGLRDWPCLVPFCCRGSVGSQEITLGGDRWPGLTFPAPPVTMLALREYFWVFSFLVCIMGKERI